MKVGIIRCMQTEDYCPGTGDFKAIQERTGAFAGIEEKIEIIGFSNCGGCPAKNLSNLIFVTGSPFYMRFVFYGYGQEWHYQHKDLISIIKSLIIFS
ncbi:CGGC domain-containing protein [Desulfoscipio gibsoniae]|uniref:CGGC domain-containing protein n=1 Tax=Desulfoscipio gibsoniae DSM 7213 TaxID=767817 RepID=R4KHA4_9FIRM|nr:CGGC domain-containing protein [Desulfoscipio gibsoniae]AGL02578.1 CGGC domain-containing protein [Desulfoscipio gibsoniae DSM 7213]